MFLIFMKLTVETLDKVLPAVSKKTKNLSKKLGKFLAKSGEIEIFLVSGTRMRHLNKMFRKKDKSTNVLSFQTPKGFPGNNLGEVYLDPKYIQRRKEDLALMLVHGVLHILGYDHEKRSDRIKMEKKEAQLLLKLEA